MSSLIELTAGRAHIKRLRGLIVAHLLIEWGAVAHCGSCTFDLTKSAHQMIFNGNLLKSNLSDWIHRDEILFDRCILFLASLVDLFHKNSRFLSSIYSIWVYLCFLASVKLSNKNSAIQWRKYIFVSSIIAYLCDIFLGMNLLAAFTCCAM